MRNKKIKAFVLAANSLFYFFRFFFYYLLMAFCDLEQLDYGLIHTEFLFN